MRLSRAFALLGFMLLAGAAGGEVRLQVFERFPEGTAALGHWEQAYLRVGYVSDRPIRVRAEPFLGAAPVPGMTSASPVYAAGSGEALVWIAYTKPARVDRLVVIAASEDWKDRLARVELPVSLAWTGEKTAAARALPDWVGRLRAEQDARFKTEMQARRDEPTSPLWGVVFLAMGWSVPLYFVLQGWLLWRWRGGWRLAAAIPAVPMAGLLVHAIYALLAGSNIFPLLLLFACPVALACLLALASFRKARLGAFVA